jgi:hypothetical protein
MRRTGNFIVDRPQAKGLIYDKAGGVSLCISHYATCRAPAQHLPFGAGQALNSGHGYFFPL